MNASTYKAQANDQKSYFVKLKRGHNHEIGLDILELLQNEGIQHIIPPLKTLEGQLTQYIDEFSLIVYPFVESQNGFTKSLTDDQWFTFGQVLRQVHKVQIPHPIQSRIRKETYSPKWRDIVRSLHSHIEAKPTGDEWAVKLLKFMREHQNEIHRLVEIAEFLGQKMNRKSVEYVLCHSDIHGGNVLIEDNGFIYLIDWDHPIMAPKERDLMFIGGGVANVWNNPHEEDCFYQGYGKTAIDRSILAYYRNERIVEDIAEYAQGLIFTPVEENRPEMYKQFIAMFEPRGVVDIAFRTAEELAI